MDSDIGAYRPCVLPSPRLFARMRKERERWPITISPTLEADLRSKIEAALARVQERRDG